MKPRHTLLSAALLLCILCGTAAANTVVATIQPLHSLVSGVMGETGKATLLLGGDSSPHDFQLKPSQVKALHQADIIFYIHEAFETPLNSVFRSLPAHVKKASIARQANLTLLPYRQGGAWEAHGHDDHGHDEHGHDGHGHDEHGHDNHGHDNHGHDEHGDDDGIDMHVWLNPANAVKMVAAIGEELSTAYPQNRNVYRANVKRLTNKINMLDKELTAELKSAQGKPFIVFHDAYRYFENAYGLTAVGSIQLIPGELAAPGRIGEVRRKLRQTQAKCVFREPQFSDRLVQTVVEGTDAKSATLDPLGADLAPGEDLYFELLRNLAANLKSCLG